MEKKLARKGLGLLLAGCLSLFFANQLAKAEEYSPPPAQPAEVVTEVIEKGNVERSDVVNFISRIDAEKIDDKSRYATNCFLRGFTLALQDELEEDPLFYAWREYDENDIIIENQALNAGWDVLVGRYPKIFGRAEKVVKMAKRITTLETEQVGGYRLKINPELEDNTHLRLKIVLKNPQKKFLDNLEAKASESKASLTKSYKLERIDAKSTLDFGFEHDFDGEYCFKATLKIPYWFYKK